MLLAVDVGNTQTVLGLFSGEQLLQHWRTGTARGATADELAITVTQLLSLHGHGLTDLEQLVVSTVVPAHVEAWSRFGHAYLTAAPGGKTLVVGAGTPAGMRIDSEHPEEVGADRIVNAVAAWERYRRACIVVDMGTATTFDAISAAGSYVGGAIAPGLGISIDALVARAARLASVELRVPERAIGTSTVTSMQSGALLGTIAQIEGMLDRFRAEMGGGDIPAIATGGHARLVARHVRGLDDHDPLLTLRGLQLIAARQPG